jgi:hypothetical protein
VQHHLANSKFYPGTERDYWVYVPKQYDTSKPAALMVFQDGRLYLFDTMQGNMATAREYAGYDHKFVFGKDGHSLKHGAAIFPDTLRWVWSDLAK